MVSFTDPLSWNGTGKVTCVTPRARSSRSVVALRIKFSLSLLCKQLTSCLPQPDRVYLAHRHGVTSPIEAFDRLCRRR